MDSRAFPKRSQGTNVKNMSIRQGRKFSDHFYHFLEDRKFMRGGPPWVTRRLWFFVIASVVFQVYRLNLWNFLWVVFCWCKPQGPTKFWRSLMSYLESKAWIFFKPIYKLKNWRFIKLTSFELNFKIEMIG